MLTRLTIVLVAVLAAGCGNRSSETPDARNAATAAQEVQPRVLVSRTPVRPYPDAVTVRLFVQGGRNADGGARFVEPAGRLLTDGQRRSIEATVSNASYTGNNDTAACFIPHHFVRYYDAAGAQVGEIAICFCCAGVSASPDVLGPRAAGAEYNLLEFDFDALKAIIQGMGLRTDFDCEPDEG